MSFGLAALNLAVLLLSISPDLPDQPASTLKIISFNLLYNNHDPGMTLDFLRDEQADLVALSEATPVWEARLEKLSDVYPFRFYFHDCPRLIGCEMALLSKHPWKYLKGDMMAGKGTPFIQADFELGGKALTVVATHLDPPIDFPNHDHPHRQPDQILELNSYLRPLKKSLILLGDFNMTPWSSAFAKLIVDTGLRHLPTGLSGTWPAFAMPLGIPIDHIFIDPSWMSGTARTGPWIGSDHLPIISRIGFTN
jgi:endonuclease/exonuclease/phosphatase (EEP) superfamily protein YafD